MVVSFDMGVAVHDGNRLTAAGGTVEQVFDMESRPKTAFCADPFGNGFCLMETRD